MSLLNLGLQNCALSSQKSSDDVEAKVKCANSMAAIHTSEEKVPRVKEWRECVKPVQTTVQQRFSHLKLKDEPVKVFDSVFEDYMKFMQIFD